jgi:PHD-finger
MTKLEEPADVDEDEIIEDEETTRCLCGNQDYPGPPVDASGRSRTQPTAATTGTAIDPDAQADEAGGLFIQCDSCKVWQHGGCVGIMDEAASPENYFCEECKPEYHQVLKSITG